MGFDEFNDKTNWTDIQYKLNDYYNTNILNSKDETAKEQYEEWVKTIQKAIDSHDEVIKADDEYVDQLNQLQDLIYEQWTKEIELHMTLDENSRRVIDLKMKALGDSFYKRVEAAWLLLEKYGLASDNQVSVTGAKNGYDFIKGKFDEIGMLGLSDEQ